MVIKLNESNRARLAFLFCHKTYNAIKMSFLFFDKLPCSHLINKKIKKKIDFDSTII